jgi:hypothetical protein
MSPLLLRLFDNKTTLLQELRGQNLALARSKDLKGYYLKFLT